MRRHSYWFLTSSFLYKNFVFITNLSRACYMYRPLHPLTLIIVITFGKNVNCAACPVTSSRAAPSILLFNIRFCVTVEAFLLKTMKIVVFWHVTPCSLEVMYRRSKKDLLLSYSRVLKAVATGSCEASVSIISQKTVSFTSRLRYCGIVRDQNLQELSFHPRTFIQPSTFPVTLQSTTHQTNQLPTYVCVTDDV